MSALREPSVWMIEPSFIGGRLPFAFQGESNEEIIPLSITYMSDDYDDEDKEEMTIPPNSIAIYSIEDVIMKKPSWFGGVSTEVLMEAMKDNEANPNVKAHVLKIDSPGGQGTNMETVAYFIREQLNKPVLAWFNGMACSAGYYIACAADAIYASQSTDVVGSIGVMVSWADMEPMYEKLGVKFHEVYAEDSDLKNKDYREAKEGKYDLLQKKMLKPFRDRFEAVVREMRPQLTDSRAFRGETFLASEAVEIGMIDGIMKIEQLIELVSSMGTPTLTQDMNKSNIEMALGYELTAMTDEQGQEGVFLRADEVEKLNAHTIIEPQQEDGYTQEPSQPETEQAPTETTADLAASITILQESIAMLGQQIDQQNEQISAQQARIEQLSKLPGASRTVVPTLGDANSSLETEGEDPLTKLNRLAAQ